MVRELLCLLTWALWFGGLTFYAAVVVPIGSEQIGETNQGLITRDVTIGLNILGAFALIAWGWQIVSDWQVLGRTRRRSVIAAVWLFLAVLLLLLSLVHTQLSSMIDFDRRSIPPGNAFYQWHRVYLIGTSLQWFGLLIMGWEIRRSIQRSGKD